MMDSFDNPFKQRLGKGQPQIGLWMTMASPTAVEIAASSGVDWLLLDMEHSPNELADIVAQLRTMNGAVAEPIVRVPWNDPVIVKRLLDCGARSLMFPYVQSADEARRAVAATRYPPAGIRGFASVSRATRYGARADYATRYTEEVCVIVQIETGEAVSRVADIAAVEGVDAVFVGPADLAASLGYLGNVTAPLVAQNIDRALAGIKAAGKAAGMLDFNEESAARRLRLGFDFIAVGGDASLLSRESRRLARDMREKAGLPAATS